MPLRNNNCLFFCLLLYDVVYQLITPPIFNAVKELGFCLHS